METEERVVVIGRAEIDTRQPFKSVKEAVTLFGESVLVREIYANKLKEIQKASEQEETQSRIEDVSAELEETKQNLQHEKEEGVFMAHCLASLKQELEETKTELRKLQTRALHHSQRADEIEELKFVETPSRKKVELQMQDADDSEYFQTRRSVKFMSPPALIINSKSKDIREIPKEASPCNKSNKKMKKKPLILFFRGLFREKGS